MIICKNCKKEKKEIDYYKSNSKKNNYLRANCKECVIESSALNQFKHKEHRKEYLKNWNANNIEKIRLDKEIYRNNNREKTRAYHREYQKNRRELDPLHKMKHNLRNRINLAIRKSYWKENGGSEKLLGGSYNFVMNYLTTKLKNGMTWDNYGEWHIDHIIPLSSANTKDELISLCHYTNLQPLSAFDNLSKGGKF